MIAACLIGMIIANANGIIVPAECWWILVIYAVFGGLIKELKQEI